MLRIHWFLMSVIAIFAPSAAATAQGDAAGQQRTEAKSGDIKVVDVHIGPKTVAGRLTPLNDFHLAAWVILENDTQVRVSQFAYENASHKKVKQFAKKAAASHSDLIASLHKQMGLADRPDGEFDVGEVLQEIAARLARTQASPRRYTYGYRGAEMPVNTAAETEDDRPERAERNLEDAADDAPRIEVQGDDGAREQTNREQRQGNREDRRDLREERRQELQREAEDRRRGRRLLAEVLPVLQDNLPAILDAIGETIEGTEAEATGLAFLEWKRQLADKHSESVIEQLEQVPDDEFAQAYLGFQVAGYLRMIDTMEVAKAHASPELSKMLDGNIAEFGEQLQEVRELMSKI